MIPLLVNKSARAEFEFLETFEAGLMLLGGEVKMLRGRHGSLTGSHVRIVNGRAVLLGAQIPAYPYARMEDYDPKRTRPLLLGKKELLKLQQAQETKGLALIPVSIKAIGRYLKLQLAIARGKKLHDRRRELRDRDMKRQLEKDLRGK